MAEHTQACTLTLVKDPDGHLMRGHCECGQAFYPPLVSPKYDLVYIQERFKEHQRSESALKEKKKTAKKPVASARNKGT